jgi:hypothetical protein
MRELVTLPAGLGRVDRAVRWVVQPHEHVLVERRILLKFRMSIGLAI